MNKEQLTALIDSIKASIIDNIYEEVKWTYKGGDTLTNEEADWVQDNVVAITNALELPYGLMKTSAMANYVLTHEEE